MPGTAAHHTADAGDAGVEADAIARLTSRASIEINHADIPHLASSQALLPAGTRIFVSHLPGQTWAQTTEAAVAVRRFGFEPVPHIPARLMPDHATLEGLIADLAQRARATEVLLIAGDYAHAAGPFENVSQVLSTGVFVRHGIDRVSLAGHPEGHHKVDVATIRRAEREKVRLATSLGLRVTLVTQFFFEAEPFVRWSRELRDAGVDTRLVAGIAGPARASTLLKYALRCGVGPSIRALSARPGSVLKLLGDHGPEALLRTLAREQEASGFDGVHLFCFGGFLRTCQWLRSVTQGRFTLARDGGFEVAA